LKAVAPSVLLAPAATAFNTNPTNMMTYPRYVKVTTYQVRTTARPW
jgi:hypothetical protein